MNKNIFSGETAALDRLRLENLPLTALIEVPNALNPLRGEGVRIYAKIMSELPWSQIKMVAAFRMLERAKATGQLDGVHTLVEASSGNTGSSLAVLARHFGIPKVHIIAPRDAPTSKVARIEIEGARVEKPDPGEASVERARNLGFQPGYFNLGQYHNSNNVEAHMLVTAAQIYRQLGTDVTSIAAGIGTAGTALGCQRFFQEEHARKLDVNVDVVGVICAHGEDGIPGMRTRERLEEVGLPWETLPYLVEVTVAEAYRASRNLLRAGFEAGPSSGAALAGGLNHLLTHWKAGTLDRFRNKKGEVVLVAVCPDNHLPYLDKYTNLDEQDGL